MVYGMVWLQEQMPYVGKKIGPRAQNMITILYSVFDIIGKTYMTIQRAHESSL